jgi:glycosyltransferase involved in cell wall biosynthesis
MKPYISVILPSLNEEKYIGNVFDGLKEQTFKDFEVIVVDGNSTDKTREIARMRGAKVVIEKRPHISRARNTGAKMAKGEILFFTDADSKPSKDLLKIYYDLFKEKEIIAATGPLIPLEQTTNFIKFAFKFATVRVVKIAFKHGRAAIFTSNFAIRKSTFNKFGGFDESLATYEDLDLAKRLLGHGAIKFVDSAVVKTSMRRMLKMGLVRFILFNTENVLMYTFFKKAKDSYEPVR